MRKLVIIAVLPFLIGAAPTGYHVTGEIKIGGEGGWDYLTVDSAARRLYVSHATHVVVVDLDAGKVVGDIPDTPGVHGIAIAPELNRGFISNGRGNNVTIFDLKTLKPIGRPPPARTRMRSATTPVSGRVFTFNGRSKNATAIDAKTGMVAATIPLPGKPEFSVADGKGKVYVNIEDTSEIVEIDAAKATVTKKYSLTGCDGPSGLAIDTKNRRLFSVCSNRVMAVSDPDAGKVVATPAIGAGSDGAAFDPGTGYAFSSNGDGTLTIVGADRRQVGRAREHRHRARRAHDRARREDAQGLSADRDGCASAAAGGARRFSRTRSKSWSSANEDDALGRQRCVVLLARGRGRRAGRARAGARSLPLAHPEAPSAPPRSSRCRTRSSAPGRTTRSSRRPRPTPRSRARIACRRRRACCRRSATPRSTSAPRPTASIPNGRFVSKDGVHMYRSWAVVHQELSPGHVHADAATAGRGGRGAGAGQARDRAARPRRHGHEELLRAGHGAAQVRDGAAGGAAGRAFLRIRAPAGAARPGRAQRRRQGGDPVSAAAAGFREATLAMDNARLRLAVLLFPTLNENFTVVDDLRRGAGAAAVRRGPDDGGAREPRSPRGRRGARAASGQDVTAAKNAFLPTLVVDAVYGIEANEFALHSRIAAQPELGVLPNLGYFVTANLTVPIWDWGGLRSKLRQSEIRERQAQVTLSQTQRQLRQQSVFDVQRSVGGHGPRRQPSAASPISPRKPAPDDPALSGRRIDGARGRRRAEHARPGAQRRRRCARRGIAWRWRRCRR